MKNWFAVALVAGIVAAALPCGSALAEAAIPASRYANPRPSVPGGAVQVVPDVTRGAISSGFVVTLSVRQPVVPMGGRIVMDMAVTNVSDQTLLFDESYAGAEFDLEIRDPAGSIRTKNRSITISRGRRLHTVEPGETLVRSYYTLEQEELGTCGDFRFIAKHLFPRLDGGGLVLVPSNPVTVTIADQSQAGQEPKSAGKAASEKIADLHIKTRLIDARNLLQGNGFSVSQAGDSEDIIMARDGERAVKVRPGSSTVFFGKHAVEMGRKADVRGNKLLIPGHIVSLIRTYGGSLPF